MSKITPPFYWALLDKNIIPDWDLRLAIRHLNRMRLNQEAEATPELQRQKLTAYVRELRSSEIAVHTTEANEQHYEVPTKFYELVLGARRKYSCCYWPAGVASLDQAELSMLALSTERARVADGHSILDVGCGWGALSLYLAETFPNSKVTGISNSRTQREYIMGQAVARGLTNVEILTANMITFEAPAQYDRIVSVEMFEHMRNYEKLLEKVSRWMKPDGLLFVHVFSHFRYAYPFAIKDGTDWMAEHFFTGGQMPSDDLLLYFQKDVTCLDHWLLSGTHYEKTARAWLQNMDQHKDEILQEFKAVYGNEALAHFSRWRIFFLAVEELWGFSGGKEWTVSHYLFERK
jgi:cyclopropane-fatty-acyl-phospholipid synthase